MDALSTTARHAQHDSSISRLMNEESYVLACEIRRLAWQYASPHKTGSRLKTRLQSDETFDLIDRLASSEGFSTRKAGKILAARVQDELQIPGRQNQPKVRFRPGLFGLYLVVTGL